MIDLWKRSLALRITERLAKAKKGGAVWRLHDHQIRVEITNTLRRRGVSEVDAVAAADWVCARRERREERRTIRSPWFGRVEV